MNFIGGIYKTNEQAINAYEALRNEGFREKDIALLTRKPVPPPEYEGRATVRDVAQGAGKTALIVGFIGALVALLIGQGTIPVFEFFPSFEPGMTRTNMSLILITFLISALIGAIIGAAITLGRSSEKTEITSEGGKRGGLLVVVNVEDTEEKTARIVMKDSGAADVENLTEIWDPNIWSRYRGMEI